MSFFYSQLRKAAADKGLSLNQIDRALGYSRNTLANYKNQNPSVKRLGELARYLGVSVDYLLGVHSTGRLEDVFLQLLPERRQAVLDLATRLLTEQNKK